MITKNLTAAERLIIAALRKHHDEYIYITPGGEIEGMDSTAWHRAVYDYFGRTA
jgi:hypothetical protein